MSKDSSGKSESRKSFLKKVGAATVSLAGLPYVTAKASVPYAELKPVFQQVRSTDRVNLGLIGAGIRGQGNIVNALNTDRFNVVAACDLYDSRLRNCRERWGKEIFLTKDYKEILERSDVDAVVIASPDHWHERMAIDSLNKGIPTFLEKPIVQHIEEGYRVIEAEQRSGTTLLVGSQLTSSIVFQKARDLYRSGEIGVLNFVEAYWDRLSAIGAWQYSIPPSASEQNVDWARFREDMAEMPFDPKHFFRWRNYREYGTGVSGDLFVHLFSALHMMIDSKGPVRGMSTGGLRYWHDGRDVEDVMLALYDYPETDSHPAFNLSMRVNFADGSGGGSMVRLVGSEGEIEVRGRQAILRKANRPDRPGTSINDFSTDIREEYLKYYEERYPEGPNRMTPPNEYIYRAPDDYGNGTIEHFINFYNAIRDGEPVLQDGKFGLRAAAPALLANISHREGRIIHWDPEEIRMT